MMAPLLDEEIIVQATPTTLMPLQNATLFAGLSNGIIEKFDIRQRHKERSIEISKNPIAGVVSLEHNYIITADSDGIIKELDLRNYSTMRTVNLNNQIKCLTIIRPDRKSVV